MKCQFCGKIAHANLRLKNRNTFACLKCANRYRELRRAGNTPTEAARRLEKEREAGRSV